jgi:hypothetical protein
MDRVILKLVASAFVLTFVFAVVVESCDSSSEPTPVQATAKEDDDLRYAADAQRALRELNESVVVTEPKTAPSVTKGQDAGVKKPVKRYEHPSKKLVWACTEPKETAMGTMVRDCKNIEVE